MRGRTFPLLWVKYLGGEGAEAQVWHILVRNFLLSEVARLGNVRLTVVRVCTTTVPLWQSCAVISFPASHSLWHLIGLVMAGAAGCELQVPLRLRMPLVTVRHLCPLDGAVTGLCHLPCAGLGVR